MVKTLEQAIAQISRLPDADQEQIGRKLLSHVEKLTALRTEVDKGVHLRRILEERAHCHAIRALLLSPARSQDQDGRARGGQARSE